MSVNDDLRSMLSKPSSTGQSRRGRSVTVPSDQTLLVPPRPPLLLCGQKSGVRGGKDPKRKVESVLNEDTDMNLPDFKTQDWI